MMGHPTSQVQCGLPVVSATALCCLAALGRVLIQRNKGEEGTSSRGRGLRMLNDRHWLSALGVALHVKPNIKQSVLT